MAELKIEEMDLYELLEIQPDSTNNEIKTAYRKKALKCHPDKNPDNPDAAKQFHQLTQILAVLTDEVARKAYDRVLKGRKEAAIRHQLLDHKRKKLKEDLEARERGSKAKSASDKLKEEIDRLRKEGARLVEEESEYMRKNLFTKSNSETSTDQHRLKFKWKAHKSDASNGGYNEDLLRKFLLKYGQISALVLSRKKGSALVEYATLRSAQMCHNIETGLVSNPLEISWVNPPPGQGGFASNSQSSTIKPSDFESVVLTKLRQAEERKKLIEEMKAADANDE